MGPRRPPGAEIRRLNALHRGIVGPGYAARDPSLSLWVHATLIESTLTVSDAWLEPLDRDRRARFYAETRPIGRAFGVPETMLPADYEAFEAYWAEMLDPAGPVQVGPLARELAGVILRPPLPGALARLPVPTAFYDWTLWPSVGLLPPSDPRGLRAALGRPPPPRGGLARGRLAGLATAPPRRLPTDAPGARRGPAVRSPRPAAIRADLTVWRPPGASRVSSRTQTSTTRCAAAGRRGQVLGSRRGDGRVASGTPSGRPPRARLATLPPTRL